MKRYTEKIIPARKSLELDAMVCDLCGSESKDGWKTEQDNEVNVEVRLTQGQSFPGSRIGTETEFDLCPSCFKERLIPWLVSQGAKPQIKEYCY